MSELSVEAFAEVSAELAAGGRLMAVLERHGLSEARWRSVQSIWLVRLAEEAGRQRYKLTDRYQKAFLRHMERLEKTPPKRDTQPPAGNGAALPFQAPPSAHMPTPTPTMELAHFAALTAEVTVHPHAVARARSRYGLDEAGHHAVAASWQSRFSADPALYQQYAQLFAHYHAWFTQQPG